MNNGKLIHSFTLNGNPYRIFEVDNIDNEEETFGLTDFENGTIQIKRLSLQSQRIRTLKHELTHVWLFEYGHNQHDEDKTFNYEDVCEIVACSNDWINEKVMDYKTARNKKD